MVEYHGKAKNGRLVKRLRHQPLTLKTWVRFPYRSPQNEALQMECFFPSVVAGTFRPHSREQRALFIAMSIIALFFTNPRELGSKHCSAASVSEASQGGANSRTCLPLGVMFLLDVPPCFSYGLHLLAGQYTAYAVCTKSAFALRHKPQY